MIRASQEALIHEANINLINIRNAEVQYFNRFYTNFGTQAAFMIGIVLSAVSQVPGWNSSAPFFFIAMFWIGSVGTIAGSVHILVCTMFITVFGEGLALRGPPGSMISAVHGMIYEQQQVLGAFAVTIFMFANFASGMYWIMMDQVTAIVCTVMTFGMMPLWYHYSLRIYNRFYWGDIDVDKWEDQKHGRSGGDADDSKSFDPTDSGGMYDGVATGYMSMKGNKRMGIKPWQRLFFVLEGQLMHYYRDQYSYERSPATALNKRPIDLDGYTIVAGGVEPPFTLVLVPRDPEDIRRTYHFRVDTRVEFERWVEAFAAALTPAAAAAAAAAAAQWQQQGVEEQLLDLASDANEGAAAGAGFAGSGSVIRLEGDVANHPALQRLLAEEEEEDADEDASTQPPAEGNPVVAHL